MEEIILYRARFTSLARLKYRRRSFITDLVFGEQFPAPAFRFSLAADVVELDETDRLHLWTFCSVHSPDLLHGEALGRMMALAVALSRIEPRYFEEQLEAVAKSSCPLAARGRFDRLRRRNCYRFDSLNLVVCGGQGWELIGSQEGLLGQLYGPVPDGCGGEQQVNIWHFRATSTGFDLRSLHDFSVYGKIDAGWAAESQLLPFPDDDFDIACKHDLRLKRRKGLHEESYRAYLHDLGQPTLANSA